MNFPVIIAFTLMLLAPCVVALWGRMRAEPEDEMQAEDAVASPHAPEAGLEPLRDRPAGLEAAVTERQDPPAKSRLIRKVLVRGLQERALQQVHALAAEEALPEEPVPVEPTLEELLEVAVGEARRARVAAMRADAAASDVAARMAAAKVEAAAEASRVARRVAEEAADAAITAQEAYEAVLLQEAFEQEREQRPMRRMRAA